MRIGYAIDGGQNHVLLIFRGQASVPEGGNCCSYRLL